MLTACAHVCRYIAENSAKFARNDTGGVLQDVQALDTLAPAPSIELSHLRRSLFARFGHLPYGAVATFAKLKAGVPLLCKLRYFDRVTEAALRYVPRRARVKLSHVTSPVFILSVHDVRAIETRSDWYTFDGLVSLGNRHLIELAQQYMVYHSFIVAAT